MVNNIANIETIDGKAAKCKGSPHCYGVWTDPTLLEFVLVLAYRNSHFRNPLFIAITNI